MGRARHDQVDRAPDRRVALCLALVLALICPLVVLTPAGASTDSGTIVSFGSTADGRLGRAGGSAPAPVGVAGRFVALAGGDAHSLAVREDGSLWSWGDNQWGQLGNGSFGPLAEDGPPALVVGLDEVAAIAAGGRHNLVVVAGAVRSWGDNTRGQLGRTSPVPSGLPQPVAGLPIDDPVMEVAAGDAHSLARTADGKVWAWGDNLSGQVGPTPLAGVGFRPFVTEPVQVTFPDPSVEVVDIAAGTSHSIAVDAKGRVWTWGVNDARQLGRTASGAQPVAATIDADGVPITGVVQADGGATTTTLRFDDGRVARLGNGSAVPAVVALPGPATSVVEAGRHVLATVDESGGETPAVVSVYEWGEAEAVGGPGTFWTATPTRRDSSGTAVATGIGRAHGLVAQAPRVTASPLSLDFIDAFGPVEVFSDTETLAVRVTNAGPGSATVSSVDLDSVDFEVVSHDCSTLAAGASCEVDVAFTPSQIGPRAATLRIDHDGFDPAFAVALAGEGTEIRGQIYVTTDPENLTAGVPASPRSIPLAAIPVQVDSPRANDTEGTGFRVPLGDIEGIGFRVPLGDIEGIGFRVPLGDIEGIGFRVPLGDIEGIGFRVPLGDIEGIGFRVPLGDIEGISPTSAAVLEQVTLDRLPLRSPWRWDDADVPGEAHAAPDYDVPGWAVLTGSPDLHGLPLQSISLADVLRDPEARERFRRIPTAAVDLGASIFGAIGIDALLIGDRTLAELGRSDDWCAQLEAAGRPDCGAGLGRPGTEDDGRTASPFELQLSGVPLGALNLAPVTIGDLDGERVPANQLFLDQMPLYESDLGSIRLADVADVDLVADCTKTTCATATVHRAQLDGALLPAAQVGDLAPAADGITMSRLLYGLMPAAKLPFGATSLEDLLVKYYGDPAVSSVVPFDIHFDNGDTVLPRAARISATLPRSFAYVPRSAVLQTGGKSYEVEATVEADQRTLTWPIPPRVAPGQSLTLHFLARPGLSTGVFTIDEVGIVGAGEGITSQSPGAPVRVVDAERFDGGNDTLATASPIEPSVLGAAGGSMAIGHLSSGRDVDLYQFSVDDVPAGSEILVELAHQQSGDGDLVLYGPAGQAGVRPLRPAEATTPLTLTVTPDDRFERGSGAVEGDAILRERSIIDDLPVLGISQQRNADDERLVAIAPAGGSGSYTVAVVPYDGLFSDEAYSLRVTVTPPVAIPAQQARPAVVAPIVGASGNVVVSGNPAQAKTLFLTAPSRLADDGSVDLLSTVQRPSLVGLLGSTATLAVDRNPSVAAAYAAWDASPADPDLANDVVRAINVLVDGLRGPSLTHLVLLGGDDVLPMARVADLTSVLSERSFAAEVGAITKTGAADSITAAAAANRVLVDDAYGDFAPTPIVGFQYLYVTDIALGRLVETEREIVGLLDQFDRFRGKLAPTTALSTSSVDFLDDTARALADRLRARHAVTTLVTEAEWGADGPGRLGDAIAQADVVSVNGHSDPIRTETRSTSGTDVFTSADLATSGMRDGAVVFLAGCHLLLPLTDSLVRAGVPAEFVQAGGAAGAASLTGNTGYGIGSRSTLGYTEQLLARYADVLGTYDQGTAVRMAKRNYLAEQGSLDAFDLKVVQELTHFGMPHLRYADSVDPAPVAPLVGSAPAVAAVDLTLTPDRIATPDGDYYANPSSGGAAGFLSAPGQPVVPSTTLSVGPIGSQVVGFMIDDAHSFEAPGDATGAFFDPVLDVVVPTGGTARSRSESSPIDVQFPANLWAAQANALRLATGLFRSVGIDPGGDTVGSMSVFDRIRGRAYVVPNGATAGDSPPQLLEGRALTDDGSTTFAAEVTDDVGVVEVSVLYREIQSGTAASDWESITLAPDASGLWTGGAAVSSETVETIFQVRDTANQVTWLTNKARLTPAVPLDPGPFGPVSISVSGDPAPSNPDGLATGWWHRADVTLNSDVALTAHVGKGEPFLVTGDDPQLRDLSEGYHLISVAAADGSKGTFVVKVDRSAPMIDAFDDRFVGRFLLNEVVTSAIACTDAVSGVASCTATVRKPDGSKVTIQAGAPLPTDQPGIYVLAVEAFDAAGNQRRTLRLYAAQYVFEGFLPPLTNLPKANAFKAGKVAPMLWRFTDANGVEVTDLDVIWAAGSVGYPCSWTSSVPANGDGSSATGLSHDGNRYRFGWQTKSSDKNSCRSFVFVFDDASIRAIAFAFT